MPDLPSPAYWSPPPGGLPLTAGRPFHWGGLTDRLFGIHFGNIGLTILTLGGYRFWGIVRIRRYVWSHGAFLGDRLEYTGTGGELLRGFLIVLAVLVPFILLAGGVELLGISDWTLLAAINGAKLLAFLFLLATGRHAARRYLASRTIWRGLRFAVTGSPWRCGAVQLGWWLATILTLGLARPWALAAEARWSFGRLHLGTQPFHFSGTGGQLLGPWIVALVIGALGAALSGGVLYWVWQTGVIGELLAIGQLKPSMSQGQFEGIRIAILVGLGVVLVPLLAGPFLLFAWFSFGATAMRWRWGNLELGGAHFAMPSVGAGRLARLQMGNWFLTMLSFGLLYPVVVTRNARFLAELVWTDRYPDVSSARQAALGRGNAEGLANVLDGGGAGLGI